MIVGFGALNLDIILKVERIPNPGEESFVIDIEYHPGGSAANTIAGLATMGVECAFIGKVGDDNYGKILLKDFEKRGVELSGVKIEKGRSGVAMIFVDRSGERAILVDPGVNDTIKYDEVKREIVENAKIIHLTSFICKNSEDSFKSQKRIAKEVEIVSFDPGMPYINRGLEEIEEIISNTTIFMPNKQEIEMLIGERYDVASREVARLGVEIVVVKLGENGCYILKGNEEFRVQPFNTKVVDTTGAGDAFNAGFLYAWYHGKSIEACGKFGNYVASKIIERVGARGYENIDLKKIV